MKHIMVVKEREVTNKNLMIKEKLIDIIKGNKVSIECLGEESGLTKQSIYNVINEYTTLKCNIKTIQSIALALGYEIVIQKKTKK